MVPFVLKVEGTVVEAAASKMMLCARFKARVSYLCAVVQSFSSFQTVCAAYTSKDCSELSSSCSSSNQDVTMPSIQAAIVPPS